MARVINKVTALITRSLKGGYDLLLFQHPYAGIQIPAGSVEANETPEAAAYREAAEETGLTALTLRRYLGATDESLPDHQRVVGETTKVFARPDAASFDWASLRRGTTVTVLRRTAGFSHVSYTELDRLDDPQYVTYQITGWVPEGVLAEVRRRHFFHLEFRGQSAESWSVETDNHRFRLFWAPLSALPEIVHTQAGWVAALHNDGHFPRPTTSKP